MVLSQLWHTVMTWLWLGTQERFTAVFHNTYSRGIVVNPQKCFEISGTDKHKDENTSRISSNSFLIRQRNYEYLAVVGMKFAIYKNATLRVCMCDTDIECAYDMLAHSA